MEPIKDEEKIVDVKKSHWSTMGFFSKIVTVLIIIFLLGFGTCTGIFSIASVSGNIVNSVLFGFVACVCFFGIIKIIKNLS